jgi:hypothetical protein
MILGVEAFDLCSEVGVKAFCVEGGNQVYPGATVYNAVPGRLDV